MSFPNVVLKEKQDMQELAKILTVIVKQNIAIKR